MFAGFFDLLKVESFKLDHTKVKAPYIRKCCELKGTNGDIVTKFDLRFLQPNEETFGTAAIHGLEHLLAYKLRDNLEGIIDFSPMGCRTGFYLSIFGDREASDIKIAVENALNEILKATDRNAAGQTISPNGLRLEEVHYDMEPYKVKE